MTESYLVKCDRCGLTANKEYDDTFVCYLKPYGWSSEHGHDLCEACTSRLATLLVNFMDGKEK